MTNVLLGVAFFVVAIAVIVWRTIGAARTVVSGEAQPSAPAQTGMEESRS